MPYHKRIQSFGGSTPVVLEAQKPQT